MAEIIRGGTAAAHALLYGDVHPGTQRFFESQIGQGFNKLTETARTYINEVKDRFGYMATEQTQRILRSVRRKANWAWHGDFIRPLRTLDDMQLAPPSMIRYIMAEPTVRRMYHQQSIAGYDGDYKDAQPGIVGDRHREYREVMEGIVQVDEEPDENGDYQWHADSWSSDLDPDDRELSFKDQLDILETWAHLQRLVQKRLQDPTSLYHASLA